MKHVAGVRQSQAGFSLIELMIVVAIIGILTTIAIPNFNRFQAKARQSEAKSSLAAIYAAEKAFYAEWSTYYGDFRDIGYAPTGRLNYHVGFAAAGTVPDDPFVGSTKNNQAAGKCFNTKVECQFGFQVTASAPSSFSAATATTSCGQNALSKSTPAQEYFLATAHGTISGTADKWSVTEGNILCNNTPGM